MTSAAAAVKEFMGSPFELYFMRGKQFTIIENLPVDQDPRETEIINKWNKKETVTFLKIEQGLFQKDLRMTKSEWMDLALVVPKGTKNLQGLMFEVNQNNAHALKYLGSTDQDLNGNRLGDSQNAPISQPQQPQDQKDAFVSKLIAGITTLEALGNKVDSSVVMKICDNISPGKGMDLFAYAKGKGAISETNGVWKVN